MTRSTLLLLTLLLSASCTPTVSYSFQTDSQRACFRPCRTEYSVCALRCENANSGSKSSFGAILDVVGDVACYGLCKRVAKRCAQDCRADGAPRVSAPAGATSRQRDLHLKLMKAEGKLALLDKRCREFDKNLRKRFAVGPHPAETSHCPPSSEVLHSCRRLTPEAVRCLAPDLPKGEREACKAVIARQDEAAVGGVLNAIADCAAKRRKVQPSSAPSVKQAQDGEEPPK
jgi:hypothetical protein